MERHLNTPTVILNRVKNGKLSKSEAVETLISLLEENDNAQIHMACIKALDQLSYKNEKIFKILENVLVSDKNPSIRNVAAYTLLKNFLKEGVNLVVWVIQHEDSPLVLKTIYDFFRKVKDKEKYSLIEEINNWIKKFSSNLGIIPEEAIFFLDLEALFADGIENYKIDVETYKYFQLITDFKTNEPWLVINNQRVVFLSYNYFCWKFLKDHKDQIESIMKLDNPHLFLSSIQRLYISENHFKKVPNSLGLLTNLKKLKLRENSLQEIPTCIKFLKSLEELDLSRNNIRDIPDWISCLSSLKILNLNHNKVNKIPESIKDLTSLTEFRINKNNILEISDSLKDFLTTLDLFKL